MTLRRFWGFCRAGNLNMAVPGYGARVWWEHVRSMVARVCIVCILFRSCYLCARYLGNQEPCLFFCLRVHKWDPSCGWSLAITASHWSSESAKNLFEELQPLADFVVETQCRNTGHFMSSSCFVVFFEFPDPCYMGSEIFCSFSVGWQSFCQLVLVTCRNCIAYQ